MVSWRAVAHTDLSMLAGLDGLERTFDDFPRMLHSTGFEVVRMDQSQNTPLFS